MPDAAVYALHADPGANLLQDPLDTQAEHKTGAKRWVEEAQKAVVEPKPMVESISPPAYGDVVMDWSQATVTDAQLAAANVKQVCRYFSPLNADGSDYGPTLAKVIQYPEYKRHYLNLRWPRKNYEWYEGRMKEGAPAGRQDAFWAATKAWRYDAMPELQAVLAQDPWARWIIFSDDTGDTPYESVVAYLVAAYQQLQQMPGYGGHYLPTYYGRQPIIAQLLKDPRITWSLHPIWQTCAWSGGYYGHGDGQVYPDTADLYQAICAPTSPTIPGCDTNFVMRSAVGPATSIGEPMIIVHAPDGSVGLLGQYGIYHVNPNEYAGILEIKAGLPAAVRETLMPMVSVTQAHWAALSPDWAQRMATLIYRGDTDAAGQPRPPGQNTHPANITFIKQDTEALLRGGTAMAAAIKALPTSIPPLTPEQVTAVVTAMTNAVIAATPSSFTGVLTPTPPTPPVPPAPPPSA